MEQSEIRSVLGEVGRLLREQIDYYDMRAQQCMDAVHKEEIAIMTQEMIKATEEIGEICGNLEI